jgi:rhodanese-related sulfurtransferase
VKYTKMGYTNVKALLGGVRAWKEAGYKIAGEK